MFSPNHTPHKGYTDTIHRLTQSWLRECETMTDKDLAVIIMEHATATAQSDPISWLWRVLAHGELRHHRNGGQR